VPLDKVGLIVARRSVERDEARSPRNLGFKSGVNLRLAPESHYDAVHRGFREAELSGNAVDYFAWGMHHTSTRRSWAAERAER